jgi:nucleoside-diphosphate-sugar epimerase
MRLLITGATGFIGGAVLRHCASDQEWQLRVSGRRDLADLPTGVESVLVADLSLDTNWSQAVGNVETIVHAAGRGHLMRNVSADPLTEYRRVNVAATLNLARQAAAAGVRRFIFLSSIKVNGEATLPGRPFTCNDTPAPTDPYAVSKHEAELGLMQLAEKTGLEVVIIRPVLVYGPGVKGNFLSVMHRLHQGVPLPFGALTYNKRSLVAVDNLADLIVCCLDHPSAVNQTFLVSDGEDLSTTEMLRRTAAALGCRAHLIPVPGPVLHMGARILGKAGFAQRLCGSLQVDINKTRQLLGWTPPISVTDALGLTAHHFLANRRR